MAANIMFDHLGNDIDSVKNPLRKQSSWLKTALDQPTRDNKF